MLEWRRGIPACFQGADLQLTNDVEANVTLDQLRMSEVNPQSSSHTTTTEGALKSAKSVTIGADFFIALEYFMTKCDQASAIHSGAGYRKLRLFSGTQPAPVGEEEYVTWMEPVLQTLEE